MKCPNPGSSCFGTTGFRWFPGFFARDETERPSRVSSTTRPGGEPITAHSEIYGTAALYDLAFSYRDFAKECAFLCSTFERLAGRAPKSFLEIAAGPGRHAQEMLASGLDAVAMDLAPEMAAYGQQTAKQRGLELAYFVEDMTTFESSRNFDLVACMLCSATYLLTDTAFASHLTRVKDALTADGRYVLELPHPAESDGPKTKQAWSIRDDGGELHVEWREEGQEGTADQTYLTRARLEYRPNDGSQPVIVTDKAPQRDVSPERLRRLAEAAGFSIESTLGALDENVTLDDPSAWRMVVVLRKAAQ